PHNLRRRPTGVRPDHGQSGPRAPAGDRRAQIGGVRDRGRVPAGELPDRSRGCGLVATRQRGTRKGIDYDTTSTGGAKQPGSQGFPGFQPGNQVDRSRTSLGVYAGLESQLTARLLVDAGGRYETYSDFGSTINGKLAGRYDIV